MNLNVEKELAALRRMTVGELQAMAEGDLTERARRRAEELANDADLRCRPPRAPSATPEPVRTPTRKPAMNADSRIPLPATTITRVYKGETLQVKVLPAGLEFEGEPPHFLPT